MLFEQYIGINAESIDHTKARHTVKGISLDGDKILLLESNRGDLTFPGGGIEYKESHQDALVREIREETGHTCNVIGRNIGRIDLRREDIFDKSKMYELISHYYTFNVSSLMHELQLSEGERAFELKPVWIDLDEAIRRNKHYLEDGTTADYWINQELYVLEIIREHKESFDEDIVLW